MRLFIGGFSLVGILVVVAIIMYVESKTAPPTIKAGEQAKQQLAPISGRGPDGKATQDSFDVTVQPPGSNRAHTLLVTRVDKDGGMEAYYGLKQGDVIEAVGQGGVLTPVSQFLSTENAIDAVKDAAQNLQQIEVKRGNTEMNLSVKNAPNGIPNGMGIGGQ